MLGTNLQRPVTSFTPSAVLNHYSAVEAVSWHVEFSFGRIGDMLVASPIANMTVSSLADQTNWYYRLEGVGSGTTSRVLAAIPAGGIASLLSGVDATNNSLATVSYRITDLTVLAALSVGEALWQKTRQYDGAAWGDYMVKLIYVAE
jgi:chitodextrinase